MAIREAKYCVIHITAGSREEAALIARALVEERLAACCNIVPGIRSLYRWEGDVQEDEEHLLICKTASGLFPRIESRVRELHSYEVPEVIALPLLDGSAPYLQWIDESLSDRT